MSQYGSVPSPQPYPPKPGPQPGQTNVLSVVALVLAFVVPIGGIICGHIALAQIKRTGEQGRGLALAGTIVGYVFVGIFILVFVGAILIQVLFFGTAAASY